MSAQRCISTMRDMSMGTRLPDDFRCGDCVHIARCNYLMGVLPENYECDFDPPKFTADVLVIYNIDGTTTKVEYRSTYATCYCQRE